MNAPVNTAEGQALTVAQPRQFDLSPQTFEQALTFSNYLAESDLVPKDFKGKPSNCLIAVQWGAELGLKPMQAMQNLAIINGRPSLWGDAVIALVRSSPLCEFVIETDDGETATCRVKRRGEPEQIRTFSMADARAAGLAGKQGPWTQYPKRMRQMRARAFALRDVFADVLRGLPVAEELMDTPVERHMGAADVVGAPPPQPAQPQTYPQSEFDKNLPSWTKAIQTGKKTADDLIAMVETKAKLTEDQKKVIKDIQPPTDATPKAAESKTVSPGSEGPVFTYAELVDQIQAANGPAELDTVRDLARGLPEDQRKEIDEAIYQRAKAIGLTS